MIMLMEGEFGLFTRTLIHLLLLQKQGGLDGLYWMFMCLNLVSSSCPHGVQLDADNIICVYTVSQCLELVLLKSIHIE